MTFTGIAKIDSLLTDAEETRNERGNRVRKLFYSANRYMFDFDVDLAEWNQFDTESDAWYFGVWINKNARRILQYVEGDIYLTECDDAESYDREVASLCAFHGPAPAAFTVIDMDEKVITDYYESRSQFFINPCHEP